MRRLTSAPHAVGVFRQKCPSCAFVALAETVIGCAEALVEHVEYELALDPSPEAQALVEVMADAPDVHAVRWFA
jgi:hypothetical protein